MYFEKTAIKGVYIIQQQPYQDDRGLFSRVFCKNECNDKGIHFSVLQANVSFNLYKGTLRGLHFQKNKEEHKIIGCLRGSIYDVCVDIREGSPTFGQHIAAALSESNGKMLLIPQGCAHGFLTLEDNCQLLYFMSEYYIPDCACGCRYDDPLFNIKWPLSPPYRMSEQDKSWPTMQERLKTANERL